MKINGPHQFKIKCEVTNPPTTSPITSSPTHHPSPSPSSNPTTPYPTVSDPPCPVQSSFESLPISVFTFMSDHYRRLEALITVLLKDEDSVFGRVNFGADCFI